MKKQFGKGLFIRNDDNGNPCHVGDIVKVTVGEGIATGDDYSFDLDSESFIGTLVLLKAKGVAIRKNDGSYVFPKLTKSSIREWEWELVKSNKNETSITE